VLPLHLILHALHPFLDAFFAVKKFKKKLALIYFNLNANIPVTKKPTEVRMGKGKGNPEYWAAVVEPGRIIFEIDGVTAEVAKEAMGLAAQKLPIKTKFVTRRDL